MTTTHPHQTNSAAHVQAIAQAAEAVSKASPPKAESSATVNPYEVGWLFVQHYYTMLNKEPSKLHLFYNSKSSFLHGTEGDSLETQEGSKAIQNRILELEFQDCKVLVSNVDSQRSFNGCIAIMVLGEMSNKGGPSHKFCQCFVLAEQPSGYFVFNDIFRFLKEDIDNEYDEPADPMSQNEYYGQNSHSNHHAQQNDLLRSAEQTASSALTNQHARGRSPSPAKKPATPSPAAAPLASETAPARARSPSPGKKDLPAGPGPIAKPSPSVQPASMTATKVEDDVGEWGESVPTPPVTASALNPGHAAAAQNGPPSSPTKGGSAKKKQAPQAGKDSAATVSTSAEPPATPAAPPKPKTWAGLVGSTAPAPSTTSPQPVVVTENKSPAPLTSKPSSDSLKSQPYRPNNNHSKPYANGSAGAAGSAPMVVKKVPNGSSAAPHAAPANEKNGGDDFREVHRGRGGGSSGGPGERRPNGNNMNIRPEQYARSIFFMIPEGSGLDEVSIRDGFAAAIGTVLDVTIPRGKPHAFVEFETPDLAAAAIGKPIALGSSGYTVKPEPRKPTKYGGGENRSGGGMRPGGGGGQRGGYVPRGGGRGGYQGQKAGGSGGIGGGSSTVAAV